MTNLVDLAKRNASRWAAAKLTRGPEFAPVAKRLVATKARYRAVEAKTGVPWFFVAVTHERESSQRWDRSLAQGDPWNRVSTHVPKGRGPFNSWEEAAIDALVNCAPHAARNKDWSIGGLLTMLEQYNGLGYAAKGVPSPYVWSGTNQYRAGKYVADHVYDAGVVDKQLGCAGLMLAMKAIDPSIDLGGKPPLAIPVAPVPVPTPKPTNTARNSTAGVVVAAGAAASALAPDTTTIAIIMSVAAVVAITTFLIWRRS